MNVLSLKTKLIISAAIVAAVAVAALSGVGNIEPALVAQKKADEAAFAALVGVPTRVGYSDAEAIYAASVWSARN